MIITIINILKLKSILNNLETSQITKFFVNKANILAFYIIQKQNFYFKLYSHCGRYFVNNIIDHCFSCYTN